jgi:FlaA1/EpsC-like NDP-sugar epimerase
VLFGRGENSLHAIAQELRGSDPDLDHVTIIGSVTDARRLRDVLRTHEPSVVFHAAAHKHVPMMEAHPDEAIANNVGGTLAIGLACAENGVTRFVNISSDKAVHPASMVGATKAIGERVVRAIAQGVGDERSFVSVRFGNVLGSRGSVVPIFQEQIRRGGPITLTHPDMMRYFMTIPEASRLVIQAGALGTNGAVYVLDMGEPVRIEDLARDMIQLSETPEEIDIEYTGLRPGEKLNEDLFTEQERASSTRYEEILMTHPQYSDGPDFLERVEQLVASARHGHLDQMDARLAALLDGFHRGHRAAG